MDTLTHRSSATQSPTGGGWGFAHSVESFMTIKGFVVIKRSACTVDDWCERPSVLTPVPCWIMIDYSITTKPIDYDSWGSMVGNPP